MILACVSFNLEIHSLIFVARFGNLCFTFAMRTRLRRCNCMVNAVSKINNMPAYSRFAPTQDFRTPLMVAAMHGNSDAMQVLIASGAKIRVKDYVSRCLGYHVYRQIVY